ncbi:PREDICTED: UPF0728 protein C10orf53 homolog [Charadrius vociferus]|uniref:UPF0728 protein C10orf53 homolog n=1 Tax=Charadrius vociferus TaxID=50402 RepID=UPI0005215AF6|nr:PREDICTED: UPF0728 protein C10orf53 homolog [Charadrius vociferus]
MHLIHLSKYVAVLQADGHQLILEDIPDWNAVELVGNGKTVSHCNINDLDIGGYGKLHPLCGEARKAVLNAY